MTDALHDELERCRRSAGKRLDALKPIVSYHKASIQLLDGDLRTLFIARGFREDQATRPLLRPLSTDPLVDRIVRSRRPCWIPDTTMADDWRQHDATRDVRAWFGAPILHDDRAVGFLTLDFPEVNPPIDDLIGKTSGLIADLAPILSRARLLDGHRRLKRDMTIIRNIVQIIGEKLDTQELLEEVVKQVVEHLSCTHCTVFFPKQVEGRRMLVPEYAYGSGQTKTRTFRANEGVAGLVFERGRTEIVSDASEHGRFAPARLPQATGRSMLVAPIKVGDQTIGVISADQDIPNWFTQSDADLLDALGQQTGIAIQRSQALTLLQDIARRILTLTVKREILEQIVAGAIELVNATTGVIYLLNDSKTSVVDEFSPPEFNHPRPRLDNPDGVTSTVVRTGQPVRVPSIRDATHVHVNPELRDHYKSMMAVPLKIDDDVIGVFFVDDSEEHRFTDMEESLLVTLASHSGVAIKQAELRDDLEARIRQHEELEKQMQRLYAIESNETNLVDRVLDLVGEGIGEMFGPNVSSTINLLNPDTREFEPPRAYGPLRDSLGHPPRPDGTGHHVVTTRTPLYVPDVVFPPGGVQVRKATIDLGVRSFAAVPLLRDGQVLGVLFVNSQRSLMFSDHERQILEFLATQAAKAIENYRLPEAVIALRRTALEFFVAAEHPSAKVVGSLQLRVPDPVRVTAAVEATVHDVAGLERLLNPTQVGYFVYIGSLPASTAEALDDLRKRRNPVVPLSDHVMTAALADANASTVLNQLERDYRNTDNLFEARNALIDERFLFGRRKMLADIGAKVSRGEHLLLFGLRKSGKTSFLNILRQHLSHHPVCSIDLQRYDRRIDDWPPLLFHQIVAAFDAWGRTVVESWPGKTPTVVASATELHDALAQRRRWQRQRGRSERLIIVLDEIERVFQRSLSSPEASKYVRVAAALRSLAQQDDAFISIIAADLRSDINKTNRVEHAEDAGTNPFFEFFEEVPMPLLTQAALEDMIRSIGSIMGVTTIAPDFIEQLFEQTGGHPFLSRLVAAAAYRAKSRADVLDVPCLEKGLAQLDERNVAGAFFEENLWGELRPTERELLLAYIGGPPPATSFTLWPVERGALVALGLVAQGRIQIALFEDWIRHVQRPTERAL